MYFGSEFNYSYDMKAKVFRVRKMLNEIRFLVQANFVTVATLGNNNTLIFYQSVNENQLQAGNCKKRT